MSLTLMPVRAGAGDISGAGSALSGFFSAAQPPNKSPAPERSELLRKSRRENPGLGRLFMQLLLGPPGEKLMRPLCPRYLRRLEVLKRHAATAKSCRGMSCAGHSSAQRRREE